MSDEINEDRRNLCKKIGILALAGLSFVPWIFKFSAASPNEKPSLEKKVIEGGSIVVRSLPLREGEMSEIDEGFFYAEFAAPKKSIVGDSIIDVIKIDPHFYSLNLMTRSEYNGLLTAGQWVRKYNLVAAINAGMYMMNFRTHCGYAKNVNHVDNSSLTPNYNSVLGFNPLNSSLPYAKMIDLDRQNFAQLKKDYRSIVQNLRMIDGNRKNRSFNSGKMWSQSAVGLDGKGNILFLFSRSPNSVRDFNEAILSFPLDVRNVMHVEGGPEASLSVSCNGFVLDKCGSYETGFNENDSNYRQWKIPNVIGVIKKQ